MELANGVG
jgi:hypothetical protein